MHKKVVILMALGFIGVVCIVGAIAVFLLRTPAANTNIPAAIPQTQSNIVNSKIYFSKEPQSYKDDFTYSVPVDREIDRTQPVETAIKELLKGPSASEKAQDLKSPIVLSGESNCGGDDFRIISNSTQLGVDIEVVFCKDITLTGIGDSARVQSVIKKTIYALEDSANFKSARIAVLDKTSNCIGDESGLNTCLM